jgi:hypothetical protein
MAHSVEVVMASAAREERLRIIERMRAAVRLCYPSEMTPNAKRVLEMANR